MKPRHNLFLLAALAGAAISPTAFAQTTLYWKGNAAATNWNATGAWTTDSAGTVNSTAAPTSLDTAVYSSDAAGAAAQTTNLPSAQSVLGFSFINGGTKLIQSDGTTSRNLTIGTGGIQVAQASGDVTTSSSNPVQVILGGDQIWNIAGDGTTNRTVNINGVLSGAGNLTKEGAGILSLGGNNTFSGTLNLNAGTLAINSAGALGGITNPLVIANGTTLRTTTVAGITVTAAKPITFNGGTVSYTFGGTNATGNLHMGNGTVTLANNLTFDNTAGVISFGGPVTGASTLTKTGTGTLALLGNNTYTGQTEVRTSANLRFGGVSGFSTTNVYLNGGLLDLGGPVVENNEVVLGSGPGQLRFKDDATSVGTAAHGGLSSASGYRKISLTSNGVPNAPLVWGNSVAAVGTPHFISGPYGPSNGIFLLSTPQAAGTIDLTNDIDFSGLDRRFSIRDGATTGGAPDAVLSGKLTNGGLSTQGGGTLLITNPGNSFTAIAPATTPVVSVTGGSVLRVPDVASVLGTARIILDNGTLEIGDETPVVFGTGLGQVSFTTNGGGISSYGTNKTVSFTSPTTPLVWGTGGFLEATGNLFLSNGASDSTTTLANPIDLNGATRTVDVRNGGAAIDAALAGVISGTAGGLTLIGGGSLQLLNTNNSYPGPTSLNSGSLVLTQLTDGGANSQIGSSSNAAGNLIFAGGGLRYIGQGNSTDRLFTVSSNATINASGTGGLVFSNTGTHAFTATSGTTTLSLTGLADVTNELRGNITNGTGTNIVAINKYGRAKWSLAGTNTHTGSTEVNAGELVLDYSQNGIPANPAVNSTGIHRIDNGDLTLKGKSSGVTNVGLNILRFGASLGISNKFTLDANGGDGIQLTVANLSGPTSGGNTQNSNLIDLSSSAGNTVSVTAVSNFNTAVHNGTVTKNVLMSNTAANSGRSNVIVRDSTGYGFATLSGTSSGSLGRTALADLTALAAGNGSVNGMFKLTAAETTDGTLTRTAALPYGSLTIDSSDGPVTLDMAGFTLGTSDTTNNNGRGMLVTGNNNVTLTGTAIPAYSPFIYHYGSGTLTYNLPMSGASLIFGGSGLIVQTGSVTGSTSIYANGNVLRFAGGSQSLTSMNGLWASNATIEIAADLNGAADGVLTNGIGAANGLIRLYGESGFSAFDGNRVLNFGGATPATALTWGTNGFLTTSGGGEGDVAFKLGSPYSNSSVEITNPIIFGPRDRVINVLNGVANDDVDAILSGVLSGSGAGLIKRGAGTLVLTAANTYNGNTDVFDGVLRITQAYLNDQSTVRITTGAKLDLAHGQTDTVAALVINGMPVAPGIYGATDLPLYLSGSGKLNVGGVSGGTTPYDAWVTANSLPSDKDLPEEDADGDGLRNLLEYAVGSDPSLPSPAVLSKASGNTGAVQFTRASGRTDITTVVETSPDLSTNSWTIVATSTAGAAFVSNDAHVTVTDSNNPSANSAVSVTDNRTPIPTKRFYRLRVTK